MRCKSSCRSVWIRGPPRHRDSEPCWPVRPHRPPRLEAVPPPQCTALADIGGHTAALGASSKAPGAGAATAAATAAASCRQRLGTSPHMLLPLPLLHCEAWVSANFFKVASCTKRCDTCNRSQTEDDRGYVNGELSDVTKQNADPATGIDKRC